MVNRVVHRFCQECGEDVSSVIDGRKELWKEDHVCDPKKRVAWKIYARQRVVDEVTNSFNVMHNFVVELAKKESHWRLFCVDCGYECFLKVKNFGLEKDGVVEYLRRYPMYGCRKKKSVEQGELCEGVNDGV